MDHYALADCPNQLYEEHRLSFETIQGVKRENH